MEHNEIKLVLEVPLWKSLLFNEGFKKYMRMIFRLENSYVAETFSS